jgi:hypothetical protein
MLSRTCAGNSGKNGCGRTIAEDERCAVIICQSDDEFSLRSQYKLSCIPCLRLPDDMPADFVIALLPREHDANEAATDEREKRELALLSVAQSKKILYAISYEVFVNGRWEARPIHYTHAETAGLAQWFFGQTVGYPIMWIATGPAIGSFDSGERKLIVHSGIRADETKAVGLA